MEVRKCNEVDDHRAVPESSLLPGYILVKVKTEVYERKVPKKPETRYSNSSKKSNLFYDMKTFPRGLLTIINQTVFKNSSQRDGSDKDAMELTDLFLDLGFYVDRYDNLSKSEIIEKLKIAANEDFSKLSCYACIILSHGNEGIIHATDGEMKIKDLAAFFCNKKLEGKPKLFFFQACQGSNYMKPLPQKDMYHATDENEVALPNEADFLFCHSTVKGYISFRDPAVGSWYMQILVKVFREHADEMDIIQMLARVNYNLAKIKDQDGHGQIGSFTSQMRKDFYFFPPNGPLSKQ